MILLKASICACTGVGVVLYFYKRKAMKNRDKEIKEEREKERRREKEEKDGERLARESSTMKHFLHRCPLREVYCRTGALCCGACGTEVLGSAYACPDDDCRFILHEVCAKGTVTLSPCMDFVSKQMPPVVEPRIITTFAHADHPVTEAFSNAEYKCKHCFTPGCGKRFQCRSCSVYLHPFCATNPTKISSYMHPRHELELKTKRHFKDCAIRGRDMGSNVRLYRCKTCEFYVHPACSQLPQYLLHDLHPLEHPLQLKPAKNGRSCDARCGKQCDKGSWCYECNLCSVSIHVACVLKHPNHGGTEKVRIDEIIQLLANVSSII